MELIEVTDYTPKPPGGIPRTMPPCPPIEALPVCRHVREELSINDGEQTEVLLAYIAKRRRPPSVTVATVVRYVLWDWTAAKFSCDDDSDGRYFVKVPSAADVEKMHGHGWYWFGEFIKFQRVLRLDESKEL
ncbi:unnamed protein product [Urochloa humidicola]